MPKGGEKATGRVRGARGGERISDRVTNTAVYYVTGHKVFPLCATAVGSHAIGIAIGRLAFQVMLDSIARAVSCPGSSLADFRGESIFTPEKLSEQFQGLSRTHKAIEWLLDASEEGLGEAPGQDGASVNVLNRVFRLLGGHRILDEDFKLMVETLKAHLSPLQTAHKEIFTEIYQLDVIDQRRVITGQDPEHRYSGRIEALLGSDEAKKRLAAIERMAQGVVRKAKKTIARLEKDWHDDVKRMRRKPSCKPSHHEKFEPLEPVR